MVYLWCTNDTYPRGAFQVFTILPGEAVGAYGRVLFTQLRGGVFFEACMRYRAYLPLRWGLAQGPSQRCGDGGEGDCDQHRCSQRKHKPGNRHPDGPFVEY